MVLSMPGHATIRFYEELNDFLPTNWRKVAFDIHFNGPESIKDLVESLGVPHPEIDLILVNGESVGFDYRVRDGDQISVYPRFDKINISSVTKLRPKPLPVTSFVLDTHLGRLAAYLRMLGFDTLYRNDYDDPTLADISAFDNRILLTCDKGLLMRKQLTHGYYVRERQPRKQLLEVWSRFHLHRSQQPFTRCMHCNGKIRRVEKAAIESRLMPKTRVHYHEFWQCPDCSKVYWKGSHYRRMQELVTNINGNDRV
jgi:uncharacterized protein with PIN domain/sulfur carrier protein ThiS